jgi:ribosomal protein RSM22 (predicted rRNA methylase)
VSNLVAQKFAEVYQASVVPAESSHSLRISQLEAQVQMLQRQFDIAPNKSDASILKDYLEDLKQDVEQLMQQASSVVNEQTITVVKALHHDVLAALANTQPVMGVPSMYLPVPPLQHSQHRMETTPGLKTGYVTLQLRLELQAPLVNRHLGKAHIVQ